MILYIILLLAIIILFILISYIFKLKMVSNVGEGEIQILQTQNFEEDNIQKLLTRNQPTVFKEIMYEWEAIDDIHDLTEKEVNELMKENASLKAIIPQYLSLFSLFLSPKWKFSITHNNTDYKGNNFMRVGVYRQAFCQIAGVSRIYLASPTQEKHIPHPWTTGFDLGLEYNKTRTNSNFWDEKETSKEPFNKLEYIEVLLKEASVLYIPKGWWYLVKTEKEGLVMEAANSSWFNAL